MLNPPTLLPTVRRVVVVAIGLLLTITAVSARPLAAEAAPSCAAFTSKVYDQVNPTTTAHGLAAFASAAVTFQSQGFTESRDSTLSAAPKMGPGLRSVHRLYRPSNKNYFYSFDYAEIARAVASAGYVDQGIAFFASTTPSSCLVPVWSFHHPRGYHRYVTKASEMNELANAGWRKEKIRFYLGKPELASVFTFAMMPDTQIEVTHGGDNRLAHRVDWLVDNEDNLDLRFVSHTGDVVNWDSDDHIQYIRARDQLAGLSGRIPYSLSLGNHDTAAVRNGGSAYDPPNTWRLVRDTTSSNTYLNHQNRATGAMKGQYEKDKIDNAWHEFSAGGLKWMVLNLELWPRAKAVQWARSVVASHPEHNVIVVTHSYLYGTGQIYQRDDYGETSPQYLFDNLIKVYPNVKLVFSGHTGTAAHRQDVGVNGNVINSFLLCMHDQRTNPVRIVEVDTKADTVGTFVYSPYTKQTYWGYQTLARPAGWVG